MAPKVVLIEDNEMIARAIARLLRGQGYDLECRLAEPPSFSAESWAQVRLVICDLSLPRRDGVELAIELRGRGFRGPILFITGLSEARLQPFSGVLAPYTLLEKPFGLSQLMDAITRADEPLSTPSCVSGFKPQSGKASKASKT